MEADKEIRNCMRDLGGTVFAVPVGALWSLPEPSGKHGEEDLAPRDNSCCQCLSGTEAGY